MHGGRKHGIEICGVKSSRRPRHTRGSSAKEEEEDEEEEEEEEEEEDEDFGVIA
jgi:ribosomal protein L12E/L44/L45/RPP1/RPP2